MYDITIRLSVPSRVAGTLDVAGWIGAKLADEPLENMIVHEVNVTETDA